MQHYEKKTRPAGGYDGPRVFHEEEGSSHTDRENPEPRPILTQEVPSPCENRAGAFHCTLAHGDGQGDFFNLSLKFAPTGSRTQDLRSAAGSPNRLS